MYRTCTVIQRILFLCFVMNLAHIGYAQLDNSSSQKTEEQHNTRLLDSLNKAHSVLSYSDRLERIVNDSRKFGYFYPDEIISLIDKTLIEVRETKNTKAEIDLLFQKIYIVSDAYSDLEETRRLSYYILDNLSAPLEHQTELLDFIARTHLAKSELVEAQNLYQEALKRLKKIKKPYSSAHINVYWGIAVTYSESQNYKKSSEYYQKCMNQSRHLDKYFMVTSCCHNLASNALKMHQWERSRKYLDSSKYIMNKITNKSDRLISEMVLFNAYGDFYKGINQLDSAVVCLKKCIQLSEKYNDVFTKSSAMQSLGSVYLEQDKLDEAEFLLLKSNEIFNEKTPSLLLENSRYLYELYKKKGMFNESLKWHEQFTTLSDSIQRAESVEIIAQATTKYEVELKDKAIVLLKKEKMIEEQSKEKYRRQWQIIIVLLLLLLVLGAFYLNHNRHQKKQKKIINQVLGEERERARISMDLHDGVCSQIANISRIVKNSDQILEDTWRTQMADKLDHLNLEVRDISHNLSLIKYDQRIPFQHIVEDYIGDLQETVPIQFTVAFIPKDEPFFLEPNRELVLFRVVQEICNNAIKYSKTETMNLTFLRDGSDIIVTIVDHGIGFDVSSSGNGIRNIYDRIEFLKGKVELDTKSNGTAFTMQIPLKQTELNQK